MNQRGSLNVITILVIAVISIPILSFFMGFANSGSGYGTFGEDIGEALSSPSAWDVVTFAGGGYWDLVTFAIPGVEWLSLLIWILNAIWLIALIALIRGVS